MIDLSNYTYIIDYLIAFIGFQTYFILYSFLRELGLFTYIYESLVTSPVLSKYLKDIGEYFYGIGISVVGGAVVILVQIESIKLFGIIFIIGNILVISGILIKNKR